MGNKYGSRKLTQEEFVTKAISVHGLLYSYVDTVYLGSRADIEYYCKTCKTNRTQRAGSHLAGKGCRECSVNNREGKHGKTGSPLWVRWVAMRNRSKERKLGLYEPWEDFEVFEEYCLDKGWTPERSICRGTPTNPDRGIYEPGNVYFDTNANNIRHALAKDWVFTDPSGNVVEFTNLKEFCSTQGLSHGQMCDVYHGKADYHKGWTR